MKQENSETLKSENRDGIHAQEQVVDNDNITQLEVLQNPVKTHVAIGGTMSDVVKKINPPETLESAFLVDLMNALKKVFIECILMYGIGGDADKKSLLKAVSQKYQHVLMNDLPVIWKNGTYYAYTNTGRAYVIIDAKSVGMEVVSIYQQGFREVYIGLEVNERLHAMVIPDAELHKNFQKQFLQAGFQPKELDIKSVIVFRNGVMNLKTKQFVAEPLDSGYFYDATLNCDFNPGSPPHDPPPELQSFFELTGYDAPELRDYLVDTIVYLISGDMSRDVAFFLIGEGANGKSTLLSFLTVVFGKRFVGSANLQQFGQDFGLEPLIGCRLNISNESGEADFVSSAAFKAVVTGEPINVNRKNKPMVTVAFSMKLLFAMNAIPVIVDKSEGMYRRVQVMRFDKRIPEEKRIKNFEDIMFQNASEIISWCIENHIERFGEWQPRPDLPNVAETWRKQLFDVGNDIVNSFVAERFELAAPTQKVTTKEIFKAYGLYIYCNSLRGMATSLKERAFGRRFVEALKNVFPEHEFQSETSNGIRFYRGLMLKKKLGE